MQYVLLIYGDESAWNDAPPDAAGQMMAAERAHLERRAAEVTAP